MKKIVFPLALLLFIVKSFGQTPALSKDYYLKKSKTQKTVAWVMLGGGVAMTTVGIVTISNYDPSLSDPFGVEQNTGPAIVAIVGIASALGSIPFFISSAKNKRRALSIAISNQKIFVPQQKRYALNTQPTLTLKLVL